MSVKPLMFNETGVAIQEALEDIAEGIGSSGIAVEKARAEAAEAALGTRIDGKQSSDFVISVSKEQEGYVSNKTNVEIFNAYSAGQRVLLHMTYENRWYLATQVASTIAEFAIIQTDTELESVSANIVTISNNVVSAELWSMVKSETLSDYRTAAAQNVIDAGKQDKLPTVTNGKYLHVNSSTGDLEWDDALKNTATGAYSVTVEGTPTTRIGATNVGTGSVADGYRASAYGDNATASAQEAIAIGYNAVASAQGAKQIGAGTNSTANTFQVGSYQMLDATGKIPDARLNDTVAMDADVVHLTGDETVAGVKTFSSSPIVPTPTTDTQAVNKGYVDTKDGIQDKRLANLEANGLGKLRRIDTDATTAYSKDVPSGAMPYATVDMVGGRTVNWNQLVSQQLSVSSTTYGGLTFTRNETNVTITGTTTMAIGVGIEDVPIVPGHIYLASASVDSMIITLRTHSGGGTSQWVDVTPTTNAVIATAPSDTYCRFSYYLSASYVGAEINETDYVNFFDLTAMFGSGNEPSTVAAFRAMFPADYYAYSANTLLNADVVNVKSVGKNLGNVNISSMSGGGITGKTTDNHVVINDGTSTGVGLLTSSSKLWKTLPAGTYTASVRNFAGTITATSSSFALQFFTTDNINIATQINIDSNNNSQTFTITEETSLAFRLITYNGVTFSGVSFDVQLEKGSTATTYSPYMTASLPIPSAARALCPLYGASAGSAYNYIDWDARVYHQRVASVDLGTLNWTTGTTSGSYFSMKTQGIAALIKAPSDANTKANIVCQSYETKTANQTYTSNTGISIEISGNITVYDQQYQDPADFKTAINGVMLYYELAEEVTVDLSSVLTEDNMVKVEAGGTLTFENSHGDNYRIPVPSSEDYVIDITSALQTTSA